MNDSSQNKFLRQVETALQHRYMSGAYFPKSQVCVMEIQRKTGKRGLLQYLFSPQNKGLGIANYALHISMERLQPL